MSAIDALLQAIGIVTSGYTPLLILLGLIIGIIVGALPGIGATVGMAILLPLTIVLEGVDAIIFLVTIYNGAMYGGSISAILFNVPGTPAAAASTFDGYPMAQQGKAIDALTISATASAIGGFVTQLLLLILIPFLVMFILLFGSPEYFLMTILGIVLIIVVQQGSLVKGITAGAMGLLLTTIGIAPILPEQRYTFGMIAMYDGLDFVAALIGVFAVAEMFLLSKQEGGIAEQGVELTGNMISGVKTVVAHPLLLLKSAIIGLLVGTLPGAGGEVSNFFAYAEAARGKVENGIEFGEGNILGVIAPESSNNATVAGALIPTLSFGIPGGGATAVLLGGLLMHGIVPGPDLFTEDIYIPYSIIVALLISAVLIFVLGMTIIRYAGIITKFDTNYIIPVIIVLSILGSFALRQNWVDVITVLVFGYIGYLMKIHNYSFIAFVLGMILGNLAETNFHRSLRIGGDSPLVFVRSPLSVLIIILILVLLFGPYIQKTLKSAVNRS